MQLLEFQPRFVTPHVADSGKGTKPLCDSVSLAAAPRYAMSPTCFSAPRCVMSPRVPLSPTVPKERSLITCSTSPSCTSLVWELRTHLGPKTSRDLQWRESPLHPSEDRSLSGFSVLRFGGHAQRAACSGCKVVAQHPAGETKWQAA